MSKRARRAPEEPATSPTGDGSELAAAPKYLTEKQLHTRWAGAFAPITLRIWRSQGRGPEWVKIGRRALYPIEAVERFEKSNADSLRQRREAKSPAAVEGSGAPTP